MRVVSVLLSGLLFVGLLVLLLNGQPARAATIPYTGLVNLGMPMAPQPWHPSDFAVVKHLRNAATGPVPYDGGTSMTADHGPDCAPSPATHQTDGAYDSMVYVCHDHVMTAINSDDNGYGEVSIQPNALVDWSSGPATVTLDMSTFRTSGRDWVDFLFTPFSEQMAYPLEDYLPDGQGEPKDAVQVYISSPEEMNLAAREWVNYDSTFLDGGPTLQEAVPGFIPSKTQRIPVQIVISRTHLHVSFPSLGVEEVDADFPVPLSFDQAVFQVTHHSYTPSKPGCDFVPNEQAALGLCTAPDTWHWSNLSMSSAVPYTLINATTDHVGDGMGDTVTFPQPAPSNSFLRFQAFTAVCCQDFSGFDISFDNGATWQPLTQQQHDPTVNKGAANIWQAVPTGTASVKLRGSSGWYDRDFTLMALGEGSTATPTPVPNTPTPSPTVSPIDIQDTPCMVALNGVMTNGTCSGTFTPQ